MKIITRKFYFIVVLLFSVSFLYSSNNSNNVIVALDDYRPLNYLVEGKLQGPSVDIVKLLFKEINEKETIIYLPWKRGYETAQIKENFALASTTRTKEREKLFKWVGPLASKKFIIYALKNSHIKIDTLDDLHKYTIGVERSTISEQMLLSRGITNLSKVNYPSQNMGMLLLKRIDLWSISSSTFHGILKKENVPDSEFEAVYVLKQAKLYIAFNKDTPDETINKWQDAYDSLIESGKIKEILEKHNLGYLYAK